MAAINDAQTRKELGRLGEELAVEYFRQHGMLVLDRNWRPQRANLRGELDLVVRDEDFLVIVEVKTRRCLAFGTPAESVTRRKLRTLHSLALAWLDQRQIHAPKMRFDVISITVPPAGQPVLEHLRGV